MEEKKIEFVYYTLESNSLLCNTFLYSDCVLHELAAMRMQIFVEIGSQRQPFKNVEFYCKLQNRCNNLKLIYI